MVKRNYVSDKVLSFKEIGETSAPLSTVHAGSTDFSIILIMSSVDG
jgi:hypothetical protein